MFGAFLAWETRKVTIPALNDSKVCLFFLLFRSFNKYLSQFLAIICGTNFVYCILILHFA